ncbi:SGNH/GDSL hydrolase family protein [Sphingomonas sp. MMS12-HWE2-04]|uniref:SGNH/GDSL hydrolase family protein n=1 Tax=Sphingomonas sp. MMS12-HWE2-04 TaxID=3234199 RepID=UPI003850E4C0
MRLISAILVLAASTVIATGIGYKTAEARRPAVLDHTRVRSAAILRQAESFPDGGIFLIGDSITEFAYVPLLCGRPVLNAGLGGSRVTEWQGLVPKLLADAKPSLVIFALGVNDARRTTLAKPDAWQRDYARLVEQVHGARVAIMGIQPIEPDKRIGPGFDPALVAQLNAKAQAVAGATHAVFIAPPASPQTSDGVHLNEAGRRAWVQRLAAAC